MHLSFSVLFFFQSLVKWSPPDDDNKCLGEVFLTMDPKHRGSPTGNVKLYLMQSLSSRTCPRYRPSLHALKD